MRTRSTTIIELPTGWLWAEVGRTYATLAGALRADNRDAKKVAASVGVVATVRTIEPRTLAGRSIARALTNWKST